MSVRQGDLRIVSSVSLILAFLGIDFDARSLHNDLLEVERCSGEGELEEEEYERCMFRDSELGRLGAVECSNPSVSGPGTDAIYRSEDSYSGGWCKCMFL